MNQRRGDYTPAGRTASTFRGDGYSVGQLNVVSIFQKLSIKSRSMFGTYFLDSEKVAVSLLALKSRRLENLPHSDHTFMKSWQATGSTFGNSKIRAKRRAIFIMRDFERRAIVAKSSSSILN